MEEGETAIGKEGGKSNRRIKKKSQMDQVKRRAFVLFRY